MASTSIGSLYGTLRLDTGEYERGIGRATTASQRFGRTVNSISATALSKLGTVFTGAVAFRAIKGAIEYGSALTDTAAQVRIGVEELQILQDVAIESGVKLEILERGLRQVSLRGQEAANGIQSYVKALDDLKIDAVAFNKLPTELKLEAIGKAFVDSGQSMKAYAAISKIVGEEAGPRLTEVLTRLGGAGGFADLAQKTKESGRILDEYGSNTLDSLSDKFAKLLEKAKRATAQLTAFIAAPYIEASGGEKVENRIVRIKKLIDAQQAYAEARQQRGSFNQIDPAFFTQLDALYAERDRLEGLIAEAAQRAGDVVPEIPEKLAQMLEKAKSPLQKSGDLALEIGDMLDKYGDLLTKEEKQRLNSYWMKLHEEALKADDATNNLADAAKDLGLTFSSAFEDAIVGGNDLRDVLKGLADDILRIAIRKAITEPLAGSISSIFSGIFGGGRAIGGPVSPDRAYLVGEEGPEMFVPGRSGVILPNGYGAGQSSGGGTSVTINQNFAVGVTDTVRAEMVAMMPTFKAVAVGAVREARAQRKLK